MSSKLKIRLLVAGHIVAGLHLGWYVYYSTDWHELGEIGLYALVLAEAGLIGIWGGLGITRLVWRLPAVIAATVYLWAVQVSAFRPADKTPNFLLIFLTTLPILVVLSVLRHSRRKLQLANLANEPPASENLQFSIRHLLMATAFVAVVLGIGRAMRSIAETHTEWAGMLPVVVFPPCFITVELATLWAALGVRRPTPRLAVILLTAFFVAAIPMYYVGNLFRADWWHLIFWSAMFGLQATITAGSLLVIRSCGWRIVSWAAAGGGTNAVADEERAVSEPLPTPPGS